METDFDSISFIFSFHPRQTFLIHFFKKIMSILFVEFSCVETVSSTEAQISKFSFIVYPGANPTITSYNATISVARF
jgi:hypothetical protein